VIQLIKQLCDTICTIGKEGCRRDQQATGYLVECLLIISRNQSINQSTQNF